jgi:oxygen-independent coproporphyrinogen-3 oxidase
LTAQQITVIFETLRRKFIIDETAEITIECNPNSLTGEKLRAYRRLGINRISIGVQSFDDMILKQLGRLHTGKQAVDKIKMAGEFFNNISIDLIVGVPNEKKYEIPAGITDIITHISVYSLMKDDKVVSEKAIKFNLPDFVRYEVSNYAKIGFESEHNKVYWDGGEYVGFGASAHGLIDNRRFCNSNDLDYVRLPFHERTAEEIKTERIMLGLRTAGGVPAELVADKSDELLFLQRHGLIKIKGGRITATEKGFRLLNQVILKLV